MKKHLQGVKIKQYRDGKIYVVEDLVQSAGRFTFPLKDGTMITVEVGFLLLSK